MGPRFTDSLLSPGNPRWKEINLAQDAEDSARALALTIAERLDRGLRLSGLAAEWRRAAWEAQHGHPAT
ncbi:MAG TPA: hypothetical protein VLJ42_09275 [Solirubrobacteraceae bacterium]|nr:hypothetical protein [Solirubrobacteraceae bacterium]